MTAKTHPGRRISTGILCLALLLGFAGFAKGNSEPNAPSYELKKVYRLFVVKDVTGLVGILEKSRPEMQIAAANYLGQLGNESAIVPLQQLSQKWNSKNGENPFDAAIQKIRIIQQKQAEAIKMANLRPQGYQYQNQYQPQPRPQGALCGHITDANTGQPVTDATVTARDMRRAQTDANGFYLIENLPAGATFAIRIDSNEYVGITESGSMPSVRIQKDAQTVKDFKLDKACMIQVQVVDEANQPVEGAGFSVRPFENELVRKLMGAPRPYPQTNKDGIALLGGLPPSKMGYLIVASQSDYAPGKLITILNSAEYIESGLIVLQKGIDVTGQAMYEDGVPASDLTISASRWYIYGNVGRSYFHGSCPVDANGNFTLRHIVPDSYSIDAALPVEKGTQKTVAELDATLPLPDNAPLTINIPKKSTQPLASIRGNMIFTGKTIPNYVDIQVISTDDKYISSNQWHNSGKDACDTSFVTDQLVPGKYKLTFLSSYIKRKTIEDINAPSEGLEVELEAFEKFVLSGTVVNSRTGEPIQSFRARIKQVQSFSGALIYQPASHWQDMNNAEGKFNIEALGTGVYQVQIAAEGFAWAWSEEVDTSRDAPVVVKLAAGGSIKGIVVDERGNPINGAKVMPMSKAVETRGPTDTSISYNDTVETVNGSFVLNNLAAGMESIKAVHPDYPFSIVDNIEVKEGQTTEGIKIVLHKGGTVEGYVYDSAGQPQPDVTLFFQNTSYFSPMEDKSGRIATVTTDASGYYRAEGLSEQICYVQKQGERNAVGVARRAFVPAGGTVTRLDFGGQPVVKGQVVFDGKPLANYNLDLTTTQSSYSAVFQCFAKTSPNGEFAFGGVPKGKWSIYCPNPEGKKNQFKIATIETDGHDIDTGVIPRGLSTLAVSIEYEQGDANWDVTDVYLREENICWAGPLAMLEKPASNNEPFTVGNIMPGRYRLIVNRGYVTQQRTIDLVEGNTNITVQIPKGTAGVRGRFTRQYNSWQILWREGKDVVCYIGPDANGNYEFNNLPAGKYYLSPDCSINSRPLLEFELAEGEQKELDIDTTNLRKNQDGILHVFLLDEYGTPVTGADIRLEGNGNTIEAITDSTPGFYFTAEPGTYTLMAKIAGYKEIKQPVAVKMWDYQAMKRPPDPVFVRLEK
jgi:protocatechuate 3,4-dioxygenase beta subunit